MFALSRSARPLRPARPSRAFPRPRALSAASSSGSSAARSSVAVAADATAAAAAEEVKPFEAIPGPKGLPLFGNFFELLKGPNPVANFHLSLDKLYQKYGRLVRYSMLGQDRLMVGDPEDIATVFRNAGKFPLREPVVPLNLFFAQRKMKNGLVTNDGPEWKRQRLLLNPAMMRPVTIETYAPRISETSADLAALIEQNRDKTTGELKSLEPLLFRWGVESVATVLFAQRIGALSPDGTVNPRAQKMIDAATQFFDSMATLMLAFPYYRLPIIGMRTPTWKKFDAALSQLFSMGREFVTEKLDRLAEKKDELNPNLKEGGDFVSYMLSKPNVTVDEIVEHSLQLLSAAADTTSNAVLSCLYHAAIYPEAQEALRKQIIDVVGDAEVVTAEHLSQMPHLRGFIKECFRVWPSTLGNVRVLDEDLILRGYRVPKGVVFFMPSYSIGRDPLNFPEPMKFDPLRWAKSEESEAEEVVPAPSQAPPAKCPITGKESSAPADSAPNPFTVLPFGFGARMCIGSKVAYLEIEQSLVHILRRFRLTYTQDRKPQLKTRLLMGLDMPLVLNYHPLK